MKLRNVIILAALPTLALVTAPAYAAIDISSTVASFKQDALQAITSIFLALIGVISIIVIFGLLIKELKRKPVTLSQGNLRHIPRYKTKRAKDYVPSRKDDYRPAFLAAQRAKDERFIANRNATFLNHPVLFSKPSNAFGLPTSGLGTGPYSPYPHFYDYNPELIPAALAIEPALSVETYADYDDDDVYSTNYDLTQQLALEVEQEAFGDNDPDHYDDESVHRAMNNGGEENDDGYDFALPRDQGISLRGHYDPDHHRIQEKFFNPPGFMAESFGSKDFTEYTEEDHAEIRRVTEELQRHIKGQADDPNEDPVHDQYLHPETHPDK
ncbi:MAG: hypothetical protein Q8L68_04850 [Methylococcales bacterium]|nr:hypothetical protein [Methylococcales bacterium]